MLRNAIFTQLPFRYLQIAITLDNGSTDKNKDSESFISPMEITIQEISKTGKLKEKDDSTIRMAIITMANGKMTKLTVMASINHLLAEDTKDIGRKTNAMEMADRFGLTTLFSRANINLIKKMEMVNFTTQTEIAIQEE